MDNLATVLIIVSLALYAAATVFYLIKKKKIADVLFAAAWCINLALFIVNWVAAMKPPFANMYHVLSVMPLFIWPMYMFWHHSGDDVLWMAPVFSGLATVLALGTLFIDRTLDWALNPSLNSPFFVPHVLFYSISYALLGLAFMLGVVYFITEKYKDRCLSAAHTFVRFGVLFMTGGLSCGAIWAEQAWGLYWTWDAKETFSLVTWLIYLAFLHLMRTKHNKTFANVIQILGFIALLGTFLGVNLLNSIHAYA